ncbi:MAG: 30S ribosomal protein S16 [Planctomycetes bacterium]|nr:30S ribosomal protein S16 [Planctomycetota bacterium]
MLAFFLCSPRIIGSRNIAISLTKGAFVAVRIRMKRMGRKHRPYFRIVAIDSRQPNDGRTLEDLGTYDPMVKNKENRVTLKPDRIKYWMSVGALPSEKVQAILDKHLKRIEEANAQAAAAPAQS